MARAKTCWCNCAPKRGASHQMDASIATFNMVAPRAGRKKWLRALSMPMKPAATQTKGR